VCDVLLGSAQEQITPLYAVEDETARSGGGRR
jgi:hypothetical protein